MIYLHWKYLTEYDRNIIRFTTLVGLCACNLMILVLVPYHIIWVFQHKYYLIALKQLWVMVILTCGPHSQVAKENDDCDEREGELQANQEIAIDAYHPPWMRPVSFAGDAAYMKPLVSYS